MKAGLLMIKKIFLITALMITLLTATAFAEKTDWSDKNYNFGEIKTVLIDEVEFNEDVDSDVMEKVLQEDFLKNATHTKEIEIVESGSADVYVKAKVTEWSSSYYIRPAYTTWEKKERRRERKRSDGKKETEIYYVEVPVEHPAQRIDTSTIKMRFDVCDSSTDEVIFSREEIRTKDSANGHRGMFGRITKSFFDDLGKKVKKSK